MYAGDMELSSKWMALSLLLIFPATIHWQMDLFFKGQDLKFDLFLLLSVSSVQHVPV